MRHKATNARTIFVRAFVRIMRCDDLCARFVPTSYTGRSRRVDTSSRELHLLGAGETNEAVEVVGESLGGAFRVENADAMGA